MARSEQAYWSRSPRPHRSPPPQGGAASIPCALTGVRPKSSHVRKLVSESDAKHSYTPPHYSSAFSSFAWFGNAQLKLLYGQWHTLVFLGLVSSSNVHAMYTAEAMYDLVSLHHHCTCSIWGDFDLHAFIEHDTLRTSYLRYHQYKNTVLEGLSDDKQRAVFAVSLLAWIEYLPVHILSC